MSTLKHLWRKLRRPSSPNLTDFLSVGIAEEDFDREWYLKAYPDVAAARIDPWHHYVRHGRVEGRLPCPNRAVAYEYHLWREADAIMLPKLAALARDESASEQERGRAAQVLERWNEAAGGEGSSRQPAGRPLPVQPGGGDGHASLCPSYENAKREFKPLSFGAGGLSPKELVQQTGWFDSLWYLEQYPDLQETTADPFEHFWHIGAAEGRDPGPRFSTSGYSYRHPDAAASGLPALAHYLLEGREKGYQALPEFAGRQAERAGAPTLLVCAHQAGQYLYGAERSLLDVLAAFSNLPVNLVVTLPSAINTDYLEAVRAKVRTVVVLPYRWWNAERPPCGETLEQFELLLRKYRAAALYVNTLVLDEPLLAARALGLPAAVHVRELPGQDEALCRVLNTSAESLADRVRQLTDVLVVNSAVVAMSMAVSDALVVPNTVDVGQFEFACEGSERENAPIRVALISSNLPKKGLADFVSLAGILEQRDSSIQCLLVGQENEYTRELRARQGAGDLPGNLQLAGYAPTPQAALEQADVVVNLSHFQESFGRTVLEAMAAARPVVAYDWGALPELIEDAETGYLVPFGDLNAVADRVMALAGDGELRRRMGLAGRKRAAERFSGDVAVRRLGEVLERIATVGRP